MLINVLQNILTFVSLSPKIWLFSTPGMKDFRWGSNLKKMAMSINPFFNFFFFFMIKDNKFKGKFFSLSPSLPFFFFEKKEKKNVEILLLSNKIKEALSFSLFLSLWSSFSLLSILSKKQKTKAKKFSSQEIIIFFSFFF